MFIQQIVHVRNSRNQRRHDFSAVREAEIVIEKKGMTEFGTKLSLYYKLYLDMELSKFNLILSVSLHSMHFKISFLKCTGITSPGSTGEESK